MTRGILAVSLALLAACSNAASNIVQRITNRDESGVRTLSWRLVRDLVHRPLWFAGIGFVTFSFLLQAAALRFGPLALVEPLLICELPLTFVGAVVVLHGRLGRLEWLSAGVMTAGLAGLIHFLSPHGGDAAAASGVVWLVGLGASAGSMALLVVAGMRARGDRRAAYYGVATGIAFGTTAALMKSAVSSLSGGLGGILTTWQTYAMVAAGILGLFLVQNALQAGKVIAAQPGITIADPTVAIVWGLLGFHERAAAGALHVGLAAGGGVLMVAGALLLSRSPVLEDGGGRDREAGPDGCRGPGARDGGPGGDGDTGGDRRDSGDAGGDADARGGSRPSLRASRL